MRREAASRGDPCTDQRQCTYDGKSTPESEVLTCLDWRGYCKHSFCFATNCWIFVVFQYFVCLADYSFDVWSCHATTVLQMTTRGTALYGWLASHAVEQCSSLFYIWRRLLSLPSRDAAIIVFWRDSLSSHSITTFCPPPSTGAFIYHAAGGTN